MRNVILRNILIFVMFVQLFSCKKDTDENGPDITYSTPFDNQYFNVYDNVPVKAEITDQTKIVTANVTLVDENYVPVHITLPFTVSSPGMSVNTTYALDNIHLTTGLYYLMITASDGKNDSRKYKPVHINGVPKELKKIFLATDGGGFGTNMSYIDSTFSGVTPYHFFSGDYLGTSVSSYYQEAFMCGNYTGSFSCMGLQENVIKFSYAPLISPTPYFTSYYGEDKNTYNARYDGTIKGYDYLGNVVYSGAANSGYYVRKMIMNNKKMIAEEKSKTSSSRILVTFFQTGSAMQQTAISQDVVAFCRKDDDNVFVFGNAGGTGQIQLFNQVDNNLWNPYPYALPAGILLSAVRIDMDTYLIGYSDGTIYKYNYQIGSVTTYLSGYTALQLKYDEVNNRVYVAESNMVTGIDYPSKTIVNAVSSAETILGMDLLYNL